ncbi:MAG: tRNA guanosine(34) transglycosylase Tgt [Elusimicrobia bacterium]|nr:tRNA guanosine(34) transglycosylase Tgt [Elusimicrobiota bacterium]
MTFSITAKDAQSRARTGILRTARGEVETPVFMPVATQGSVKAVDRDDLAALGVRIILANSYHLYLRPGCETVEAAGGLHGFMGYGGSILTDSGGFQVFSLERLRKVDDQGVTFQSHHDGSLHTLTPEGVVRIQARLGSDIWTVLDECVAYPSPEALVREALRRTQRWAEISKAAFLKEKDKGSKALLFPILQGGMFPALRLEAAERLLGLGPDGFCLGGFSVGEPKELTWSVLDSTVEHLPEDKPRYLMGMGAAEDLWDAAACGVDMMDCVWPTRNARNGQVFARRGSLNIKNAEFRRDFRPIEEGCPCPACRSCSRAYLCHLYRCRELSVYRLLTLHNLHHTLAVMKDIREAIQAGRFEEARRAFKAAREGPRTEPST